MKICLLVYQTVYVKSFRRECVWGYESFHREHIKHDKIFAAVWRHRPSPMARIWLRDVTIIYKLFNISNVRTLIEMFYNPYKTLNSLKYAYIILFRFLVIVIEHLTISQPLKTASYGWITKTDPGINATVLSWQN